MITIVSGLPRSGTSLMMQMLEKGGMSVLTDGIRKFDSNNQRGYYEYEKVKNLKNDNKWLNEADGKAVKIVSQLLPFVSKEYDFQIIYMIRPIEEVINSQMKMLENIGQKGATLSQEELTNVYTAQMRRVQHWIASRKIKTLHLFYPEIVNNPVEMAKEVQSFLDLDLDVAEMALVVDGSLWHQRKS